MDKVVVAESKPVDVPRRQGEPEPTRFSATTGGPIVTGKIGEFPIEVGLWPWFDVFTDEVKFKPPRTRIDVELVRIKW